MFGNRALEYSKLEHGSHAFFQFQSLAFLHFSAVVCVEIEYKVTVYARHCGVHILHQIALLQGAA